MYVLFLYSVHNECGKIIYLFDPNTRDVRMCIGVGKNNLFK